MFRQRLPCEGALAAAQGLLQSASCQALLETSHRVVVPREQAIGTFVAGQRLIVSQAQPARAWTQKEESPNYGFAASATFHSRDPNGDKVAALQQVAGTELYKIKIVTGALRGAGTHSRAVVQLIGTNGVSPRVVVGGNEEGFPRGSTRSVPIVVPHGHLGSLRRVLIQKEDDGQELGGGWYLKHVEVQQPTGDHILFPCESWLGDNDSGTYFGALERNLLPAVRCLTAEKPSPVKIQVSGMAIPHPEKVIKSKLKGFNTKGFGYGGEDSYFFAQNNTGVFAMGVADGVYMWREQGIDSGLFSRSLMEFCKQQIESGKEDVIAILDDAVSKVQKDSLQGSTTLCMLTVNQHTGQLKSANLGDSGFLVFSLSHGAGYDLKYRTNQLEHSFGCPYQLGHHANANKIEDSEFSSLTVSSGDVIVMGSDGLLDNLGDMDMAREISDMMRQGMTCSQMTQRITKLAFDNSLDRKKVTPYSQGASEAFDMVYSGGKPDDITVMVAVCQ